MVQLTSSIYFSMRAATKKIDKTISDRLQSLGISIPQSFILSNLLKADGLTLKEIGEKCLIDSSSMTVLIDKLEKEGLVERRLDNRDRRAIRIFITDKGRQTASEVVEIGSEVNNLLFDLIGEENQKEFLHGLSNIINHLG
ncbi:MAG: MarR family winged helix-turn-helix transcriptional regulator [Syntrophomonadaceae bacterium]|jgi:DNA-binding MarR family transcriptional regulator